MENPFDRPGEWLRCALHAHTTRSDGELEPEALASHYAAEGFDVLAITDHWVRTPPPKADGLLVLPGTELDAYLGTDSRYAHVLALGVTESPDPPGPGDEFPGLEETIAWVEASGGLPFVAHTYWSGLRTEDWEACAGIAGLEVYNAGCELEVGRGLATIHWDELLETRPPCVAIATDDSHHPGLDSGLAWVSARCDERSEIAVLEALRRGWFYSSTGPELHDVRVDEEAVEVRCSPARSITLVAGRAKGARANAGESAMLHRATVLEREDAGITAARLERPAAAPYGRLEVEDAQGRAAWTNPLWP